MKAPLLATQNRFNKSSIDTMKDYDSDTVVVLCNVKNGRRSQATVLSAPEACLIPGPKSIDKKPKKGVKNERVFI